MTRPSGTGVERQTAPQRSEGGRELEQPPLPSSPEAGPYSGFNRLQRTIGNQATARLVQRQHRGETTAPSTDAGARALFELGRVAYEHGRYDEALRHFETVTRSPELDAARMPLLVWNLALTKAHLGDIDGAMTEAATYGQSGTSRPASQLIAEIERIAAQRSGRPQGATAAVPETDADARAAFELGRVAYEAGRYDEAQRHFETVTRSPGLDPTRMPLLVWNLALTRAHLGDIDGAMTEAATYGQSSTTRPASQLIAEIERIAAQRSGGPAAAPAAAPSTDAEARAAFELGRSAYDAGRYDEARRHFESARQSPGLDPARMPLLVWNLALARAHLGDIDGAMTEAMDYGQFGGALPPSQLVAEIDRIGADQAGGHRGHRARRGRARGRTP